MLSQPELVVRAPGDAELCAGGELPIKTNTQYSSQLFWKSYGLTLKLHVTEVTSKQVRADVFTEVSHLDQSNTLDDLPIVQANRMKTQVDAEIGKPLLLSGLLQQDSREQAKGLPFLRKLPVLGKLFESRDYLEARSELVAVLYPTFNLQLENTQKWSTPGTRFPRGIAPIPRISSPTLKRAVQKEIDNNPWVVFEEENEE